MAPTVPRRSSGWSPPVTTQQYCRRVTEEEELLWLVRTDAAQDDDGNDGISSNKVIKKEYYRLCGRVVSEKATGNMKRQIVLDVGSGDTTTDDKNNNINNNTHFRTIILELDAEGYRGTKVWMTIKHARKLLCTGILLTAWASRQRRGSSSDDDHHDESSSCVAATESSSTTTSASSDCRNTAGSTTLRLQAERIAIQSVLPTPPYLARLLSFSLPSLRQLFLDNDKDDNHEDTTMLSSTTTTTTTTIPNTLLAALHPCTRTSIEQLLDVCRTERTAQRSATLFKHAAIVEAAQTIRLQEQWTHSKVHTIAPTKRYAWQSLVRLEAQWCHLPRDGPVPLDDDKACDSSGNGIRRDDGVDATAHAAHDIHHHHHNNTSNNDDDVNNNNTLVFGTRNVDPLWNLPDPTNVRRRRYVNERKRPQIQWMIRRILRLIDCEQYYHDGDCDDVLRSKDDTVTTTLTDDNNNTPHHRSNEPAASFNPRKIHLVDVGGGRGDLAMTVAAVLVHYLPDHINTHVTVLDVNQSSLLAGQCRCREIGLDKNMTFRVCDVSDPVQIEEFLQMYKVSSCPIDVLFGLHCCGGLSEAAVELALAAGAQFCISTCCFRSHPSLASLSRRGESLLSLSSSDNQPHLREDEGSSTRYCTTITTASPSTTTNTVPAKTQGNGPPSLLLSSTSVYQDDWDRVALLTTGATRGGQHRAIRVLNAIRLAVAEERFRELRRPQNEEVSSSAIAVDDDKHRSSSQLVVWQESFPVKYSVQNRVLLGTYKNAVRLL